MPVILIGNRHDLSEDPNNRVLPRIYFGVTKEGDLVTGVDQEGTKYEQGPRKGANDAQTNSDEYRSGYKCADDSVEQCS